MNKRYWVAFLAICLLLSVSLITAGAEEIEDSIVTGDKLFATEVQTLSASEICMLLEKNETVRRVNVVDDSVYYIENNVLYCYNTTSDTLAVAYSGNVEIDYYVPGENGVLIGTTAPINESGEVYTTTEAAPGLTWNGTYYFYDYESETLSSVTDPGSMQFVLTATGMTNVSYSTTVNGKAIPSATYPIGSNYTGSDNGGTQCHGFGFAIIKYLYGAYNNVATAYPGTLTGTQIKNNYPLGTMIRAEKANGSGRHTMIYVGSDSTGIYVYHANWDTDSTKNIVYIHHIEMDAFDDIFSSIVWVKYHTHAYNTVSTYSATQHKKSCICGRATYQNHVIPSWIYHNASKHAGTCSVCSYQVLEVHTTTSGVCTKCSSTIAKSKDPILYE